MKVRIRRKPGQEEIDGVRLDGMKPGSVREVSSSIGSWLIAERYAEPEMRASVRAHEDDFLVGRDSDPDDAMYGSRRRRNDR